MSVSRITLLILCSAMTATATYAGPNRYYTWGEDYSAQGLIGAVMFDELEFEIEDSAEPLRSDLSTLPQFGGAWGTVPLGDRLQFGLDSTLLVGFRVDKVHYIRAGAGSLQVSLSTSLWLLDLSGGAYANLYLDKSRRVRLHAGAGPLMMYVNYRADRDYNDGFESEVETETAFGIGAYARAGLEYRIDDFGMAGLMVRSQWADIDLQDAGGAADLNGIAVFATFTAGF